MTTNSETITRPEGLVPGTTGMITSYRRSPVEVLLDTSLSMLGIKIDGVNDGLDLMLGGLNGNPIARETVIMNRVAFGGTVTSTGFQQLSAVTPLRYTASGSTPMGAALDRAADDLLIEVKPTNGAAKGDYSAHVWILSDGAPTDTWQAAADRLRNLPQVGMMHAIAIGDDADLAVLRTIVGEKGQVFRLTDITKSALEQLFVWVSAVTVSATTSRSTGTAPAAVAYPNGLIPTV